MRFLRSTTVGPAEYAEEGVPRRRALFQIGQYLARNQQANRPALSPKPLDESIGFQLAVVASSGDGFKMAMAWKVHLTGPIQGRSHWHRCGCGSLPSCQ